MTIGTENQFPAHIPRIVSNGRSTPKLRGWPTSRRIVGVELENAFLVWSDLARNRPAYGDLTALESDAKRLVDELKIINPTTGQVGYVPAIEASPYGDLSPDRRAVMELLSALNSRLGPMAKCDGGLHRLAHATRIARRNVIGARLHRRCWSGD